MTATLVVLDRKARGDPEVGFFLDLIDVLRVLPETCHDLSWAAFDLWIECDEDDPQALKDVVRMSETDAGARLNWDELWALAKLGYQVIEGQFVGYDSAGSPPVLPDRNAPRETQFKPNCEAFDIVLEAVDSSFWQICSKDIALIEGLAARFQDTEMRCNG